MEVESDLNIRLFLFPNIAISLKLSTVYLKDQGSVYQIK